MKVIKNLLYILFILIAGCAISKYPEGDLLKTKAYCGRLERVDYDGKNSFVITSGLSLIVKGKVIGKKGSYCYVRREICYQDVASFIQKKLEKKYFICDSIEYRIKSDVPYRIFKLSN